MDVLRKTHTVVPFLVAMFAAVAGMPTNIFQVCRRQVGTIEIEPWLTPKTNGLIRRALEAASGWMRWLMGVRAPALCAAAMLALMIADLHAAPFGLALATLVPVASITSVDALRAERVTLLREAEALSGADFKFETDAARAAGDQAKPNFDSKMARVKEIDARIKELETPAPAPQPTPDAIRAEAVANERARVTGIEEAVRVAKLEPSFAADMVKRGIALDVARGEIFAKLASQQQPLNPQVRLGEDGNDKWMRDAENWLLTKAGVAADVARAQKIEPSSMGIGHFRGMTLMDLARETLRRSGRDIGFDKMRIVADAFTYRANITQSTSDFSTLLENVMHKMLQASYTLTPDTWSRFCARGSVSDFRAHPRYRHGNFAALDTVGENGEFKRKQIADGEKESLTAATKGNIINVSRQMIINDDIGVFTQLLGKLGRAAKLSIEVDVYALLALNSGDGPTMNDSVAMFHTSSHGANKTTGAALSAAALDLDRVAMASQRDPNSNDFLALTPAVLVLPVSLGGQARVINQSQYDPDTLANKAQMKINVSVGLFRDIVDTPRITGTRRYLFADPSVAPVIEVAFLDGQSEPVLETKDGWDVDGTEMKVRIDYAVGGVDWRGAVTNAGA